jgi:hypothetical protein
MNNTDYNSFRYGIRGNENSSTGVGSQFGFSSSPYSGGLGNQNSFGSSFPSSQNFGSNFGSSIPSGQNFGGNFGSSIPSGQNFGTSFGSSSFGQNSFSQNPSTEAYHTANYRGNQEGHDQGLRGDSLYPAQQQGGMGMSNTPNYGSFRYGVRGNENTSNGINNGSSQFGFSSAPFGSNSGQNTFR